MRFEKYEGLGNDFVLVEEDDWHASGLGAPFVCDRHFGIGADGVLVLGPGRSVGSVGSMVVLNADGSRPEMCGNGLRCVALWLASRRGLQGALVIDTDSGPFACVVDGNQVAVEMGLARLEGSVTVSIDERSVSLERASLGNPHAVTFEPLSFEELAPKIAVHKAFPQGVNVEFVRDTGQALEVQVWERGAGPTLACGTGACAVAAVACATGRRKVGEEVTVRLPGGRLQVLVREDGRVRMMGPARRVFSGEIGP
ncbi:MAG: diaminopimelate epimerase [Myxococcales bacterium]|nr:diaminopimelate epimerase [Polyangiaceae bacterium]MDW8248688.1 diaminopimelate epimerase [Myxococcales bacterium]